MSFTWPEALLLLSVLPLLLGIYIWMQQRRRQYVLRYASVSLVSQAVGSGPGIKRHIPPALYFIALAAMILALARPVTTVPVLQDNGTIILTVDVSGSMQAEDVEPNRLEATKDAMRDFVERQPDGIEIGVVSFSDYGALVAPPTKEREAVLAAIERLRPQRSTNMGGGLQVALDAIYEAFADVGPSAANGATQEGATPTPEPFADPPPASIVLISDGESKIGPPPEEFADEAAASGIKIYTIGIGTPEGAVLRIQGQSVFTRLDEAILRQIADTTEGRYFNAQDTDDLRQIYDELDRERSFEDEETEITFALTGVALVVSMIAGGLGLVWFNRLP